MHCFNQIISTRNAKGKWYKKTTKNPSTPKKKKAARNPETDVVLMVTP